MVSDEKRPRRSVGNFWVRPGQQLRLLFYMCGLVLIALGVGVSFGVIVLDSALSQADPESVRTLIFILCGSMAALGVIAAVVGYIFIQRLVGPLVPIERMLDAMIKGDYSIRVKLRKTDEFHDLATKLNELCESLEAKRSRSSGS